ncbi:MAG: 16S rRNA (cytosine(967)-C(5))-methyltransferase RsmB [Candidatus Eremiobacteraeota bacterium]|nr:16S rRNA (cytosine(967)-C(5))-methyltransferase RsmB [Candidatus Eremiobacteraeota bacterium]
MSGERANTARDIALQTVRDVFPSTPQTIERGAQDALDYRARKANVAARDRAFATELAYGAIKMRRTLDWYLQPFIGERASTLPSAIREVLRLAVYELVYTRPDVHATVFEWVNVAKRNGHRGVANLVNAVLRSFLRDPPLELSRDRFDTAEEYLGTRYSLPTWLVRQWSSLFGENAERVCAAVNDPAGAAVTINALKTSTGEAIERFKADGVDADRSRWARESVLLSDPSYARRREADAQGTWWIQSESSAMPVDVLNPQPGEAVLDVCSGRGNKALQTGARMSGDGTLVCIEREDRKGIILQRRLEQAGITAGLVIGDAATQLDLGSQRFDRVLIDAPCSGIGVVGRHPETRWKKQQSDGERLSATQAKILERIAASVETGGALVYAVCSTDPRETFEVVNTFVAQHNFERGLIPASYEPFLTPQGDVLIPPGIDGRDGFFIARLERR